MIPPPPEGEYMPMKVFRCTLVLACATALVACGRGAGPAPLAAPVVLPVSAPELIYYDNGGGIQDSVRVVVRDEDALREIWQRATSTQNSPPPPPSIDFRDQMVIVAGAGRMTPEDMIRMDSVSIREESTATNRRERVMEVVVHTVTGCQTFTSDAYPLAIVRLQRFDGSVRFIERRQRAEGCAPAGSRGPPRETAR
jgi:hypothetical protein